MLKHKCLNIRIDLNSHFFLLYIDDPKTIDWLFVKRYSVFKVHARGRIYRLFSESLTSAANYYFTNSGSACQAPGQ